MLSGSFKITGREIFDKSLPIAFRRIPNMLTWEVSGEVAGKTRRRLNTVWAKSSLISAKNKNN